MPDALNKCEVFLQNLKDAGCDETFIKTCMELIEEEKIIEIKKMLSNHKNEMMQDIRKRQKEMDCLDYLIYSLEKNKSKKRRIY